MKRSELIRMATSEIVQARDWTNNPGKAAEAVVSWLSALAANTPPIRWNYDMESAPEHEMLLIAAGEGRVSYLCFALKSFDEWLMQSRLGPQVVKPYAWAPMSVLGEVPVQPIRPIRHDA